MKRPRWVLKMYPKSGDLPARVYELSGVTAKDLQKLFAEPRSNPMYDCYPVSEVHTAVLEEFIQDSILLSAYDYFVECESND